MNIVRQTRETLGLTQNEFAKKLGKSLRTIAGWESLETIEDELIILTCQCLLKEKEAIDK